VSPDLTRIQRGRGSDGGGRTVPSIHSGTHLLRTDNIQSTPFDESSLSPMPETKSAKEITRALLDRLDDDVTFEDILYELHALQKIERGRQDAEEGRVTAHEDVRDDLDQWLK